MGVALNVQVLQNGQLIGQHEFDSDVHRTIKIGRLPSAQVKIEDPKVSRIHAVIEFAGTEVSLIDMSSTVGTAVNGAKVHKVKLNHGDQILFFNRGQPLKCQFHSPDPYDDARTQMPVKGDRLTK